MASLKSIVVWCEEKAFILLWYCWCLRMGIDLGDLFKKEECSFQDLRDRVVVIDAHNVLHQFLSSIRSSDGTPLKDARGGITSHYSGLLYRTANLVEAGIKPVYVFDGRPHPLKEQVLQQRRERREKAELEWQIAIQKGDLETARVKAQQTSRVTEEIIRQSQEFLEALGIPFIQAPSEGEAQASYMVKHGHAYAVGSQDYDCLLFGAPLLIRNLTSSGKRKLPSKNAFVKVNPELIRLQPNLKTLGIHHEQLIDMAILIGTDFNTGVRGIGPKKSLELIKKMGTLEQALPSLKDNDKPTKKEIKEIRSIFLTPEITDTYSLLWSSPDHDALYRILCDEHQFSSERVKPIIEKFSLIKRDRKQKNLFDF